MRILDRLLGWARTYRTDPGLFRSFAVMFEGPGNLSEVPFETALWDRVQSLPNKDVWRGQDYHPRVGADPDDPHFSLSLEVVAGSRNPMLSRQGDASEAPQYSGRMVDDGWRCPFGCSAPVQEP